jgi:hypothetical protein
MARTVIVLAALHVWFALSIGDCQAQDRRANPAFNNNRSATRSVQPAPRPYSMAPPAMAPNLYYNPAYGRSYGNQRYYWAPNVNPGYNPYYRRTYGNPW